jgi:CrcB protein
VRPLFQMLFQIGLVSLGGALGALLRWGVGVAAGRWLGTSFPWGTFIINISGSLFLGWFMTVMAGRLIDTESVWLTPNDLRLMVAVGFTGAYTTFSTFEYEASDLLRDDPLNLKGLTYLFASVFLGLVAVRVGIYLGRWNGGSP